MRLLASYCVGLIFGVGIIISGMANPAKVLNFFDIAGFWDPSLAFVMGGALLTTALGYRFVLKWRAPAFESAFSLPTRKNIDTSLVAGSATFGVGWGISGFCPGAAIPALGMMRIEVFLFMGALIAGILTARLLQRARADLAAAN
ncbi:MAG: YeeE/YedE family protein [Silicimonas sp.]|nr:YeeE/YedE family protein [Silicimonas sp.]